MALQILTWWLVVQVIGLAGLPLAGTIFRGLPDRGYAFAKSLGLLLVGFLAWLLAMLGLGGFGAPLITVAALAVAGIGVWLRGGPRRLVAAARAAWQERRAGILAYEALFLAAMLLAAWMRAHDPTPWGTERPMDYAFFNAIQRSPTFPPSDPWLAGYSINYYYFGYLLMAAVAQLSGLAPAVAYNLALALIFALTALGVAGLVANLMLLAARHGAEPARRPAPTALAIFPLLGVIFVLLAGNQSGLIQVILGDERAVALNGPQLAAALGQAASGAPSIVLPAPIEAAEFGEISAWERRDKWADFNWWWPSRSLWDDYRDAGSGAVDRRYVITEFPLFSFRLGDMHPHVMALPFGLLAIALALSTAVRPGVSFAQSRAGWTDLVLSAIILGSLYAINSWDLPTYLLLYAGALALLYIRLAEGGPVFWVEYGRRLANVAILAFVLFAPFHLTFRSLVGGAAPLVDLPLLGRLTSIIAPYTAGRSGLHAFLIIFGLFALPLIAFIYLAAAERRPAEGQAEPAEDGGAGMWQPEPNQALGIVAPGQAARTRGALPLLPPALLLIGLVVGFPLLALVGLGLLALFGAMRRGDRPAESFALLLAALGCAVVFGTELIYIRDTFEGWSARFNTIFKFYYQVWLIWGALAPFALWWLLGRTRGAGRALAIGTAALTAALLAGALVFPAAVLRDIGRDEIVGLDGRTPREQSEAGRASIDWLRQNAAAGSVVLEAVKVEDLAARRCGGSYNGEGYANVSAASGLPAVLGWVGHESQWRGGDPAARAEFEPRCAAVDTIYASLDVAAARDLLAEYGVRYVYVGGLERSLYAPESLSKFDGLGERVFDQDEVTIYRIVGEAPPGP
jgi:YYY domain-containing protein